MMCNYRKHYSFTNPSVVESSEDGKEGKKTERNYLMEPSTLNKTLENAFS